VHRTAHSVVKGGFVCVAADKKGVAARIKRRVCGENVDDFVS